MLAGQAEDVEVTWRSLYACSNGWRGLQPGCTEVLELTSIDVQSIGWEDYPAYCILDGQELGWTATAGGASELLVVTDCTSVQVTLRPRTPPPPPLPPPI